MSNVRRVNSAHGKRLRSAVGRKLAASCSVLLLAGGLFAASGEAFAVGDEVQVYTDEINEPGQFGLEMHMNYAVSGTKTPDYEGELPSHHVFQTTAEFSYGLTKTLEAGLYLPTTLNVNTGTFSGNGAKLRLKYIAAREEGQKWFWGVNTELGHVSKRISESAWNLEFRPILGWESADWLVAVNPNLDFGLSDGVSKVPSFDPSVKVGYAVASGVRAGVEVYGEMGPLNNPHSWNRQSHFAYGVIDIDKGSWDINLGVGRGFDEAPEKWIIKGIIGMSF